MFRASIWGLLAIIAAALVIWFIRGASLEGPRVAGWTDLGTWGWSGGGAIAAIEGAAKSVAEKIDKKTSTAKDTEKKDLAKSQETAKPSEMAEASKPKEAAPWNVDDTKGVDIDLNIKMPWGEDAKKAAPATEQAKGVPHGSPWPIATEVPNWGAIMKVPAPAPAAKDEADWAVEQPAKTATEPAARVAEKAIDWPIAQESVSWDNVRTAAPVAVSKTDIVEKAIEWVIANEPVKWTNVRIAQAPTEEPAARAMQKAIDWPIADAPIKWTNVRIAEAPLEEPAARVTEKAIDWPIADAPVKWTNVRAAAVAPEATAGVVEKAIDWPIADAPIAWTNVRIAAAAEPEPEPATRVVEKAIDWPIADAPVTWSNVRIATPAPSPPPEETARRQELTPEQIACEDELRKIYAEGVIQFQTNSSKIDTKSTATLDALAKAAKSCAKVRIRVEGHTDDRGSSAFNQALSERRAQAVVSYLTGAGVDSSMVSAYGYGEDRPIAPNTTEADRQKNRRIVFTVE